MNQGDIESMSTDELWALHEKIVLLLKRKAADEKAKLDGRLRQLGAAKTLKEGHVRHPYPQVLPKYRNPANPSETWAGRGKQPRWLKALLKLGKKVDDFRISRSADPVSETTDHG